MRITIGSPVRGEELWDREREIEHIWKALETSPILLTAPRRFGKTSIMLHLLDHPRQGWQVFYFDAEGIARPEDFIAEIILALQRKEGLKRLINKFKRSLGNLADRISEISAGELKISLRERLKLSWRETGQELIEQIKDSDVNTRTIFIVDELPLMLKRMHDQEKDSRIAGEFLGWLRSLRQNPDLHEKVRWVFGGSIGIEHVPRYIGAGTKEINDLERISVRELDPQSAHEFIKLLFQGGGIQRVPKKIINKFLEVIGIPIPFFIQILARESLNEMERPGKRALTEEIIERAYEEGVLATYNRTYFEHYYERLKDYYSPELANIAKVLLTEIARRGMLTKQELWTLFQSYLKESSDENTFSRLLSDLENDFYLKSDNQHQTFQFATKVLRDWWLRYHVL